MRQHLFGVFNTRRLAFALIPNLTVRKWNISVLDHVANLPLHCDHKQSDKIHDQDGPEHGYIKHVKECAQNADDE